MSDQNTTPPPEESPASADPHQPAEETKKPAEEDHNDSSQKKSDGGDFGEIQDVSEHGSGGDDDDDEDAKPKEANASEESKNPLAPGSHTPKEEKNADGDEEKKEEDEGEKIDIPPRPQHYEIHADDVYALFERRDQEKLLEMGGLEHFMEKLAVSPEGGIQSDSIEKRIEQYGENMLDRAEPVTFLEMLIEAFSDRIIQLLIGAAVISIIFGLTLPDPHTGKVDRTTGWIKGTAIILSVLVVTLTGSINNYQKAKKFEELEKEQNIKNISVFRDGREQTLTTDQLLVGDIIVLETGMEMPCDALLIQGSDLRTNEAPITGEPDLILKTNEHNSFLISGTAVEEGTGKVLVVAVGMMSFQGRMKEALSQESGETPLQEHLGELADNIGKVGMIGAVLLMVALVLKEVILITTQDKEANAANFLAFVIIAITIIAVAIPEGLPLAVTISLAWSMKAMMEEQCMVRVLASCETMGAATAICSDKTGTLTTNTMTTIQGVVAEEEFMVKGFGLTESENPDVTRLERNDLDQNKAAWKALPEHLERLSFAIAVNSTARQQTNDEGVLVWAGNNTEAGMLGLLKRTGHDYAAMRESVKGRTNTFPFSSKKKRMTTLVRGDGDDDSKIMAYTKGASEKILESCDRYLEADGTVSELNEMKRATFGHAISGFAGEGNRTIGVAYTVCEGMSEFPEEEPELQYIWLGVLGIQDPIREEVPAAVEQCVSAGVIVRMVTGDNIETAKAIGKKCHIYDPEKSKNYDLAMEGPEFRRMAKEDKGKLLEMIPRLRILARSSPDDKHILVGMLQEDCGEVVGVTGDGTNDAPALKLADVGFAMNTGTDIARGASDMVLMDDNFATVVTAIRWGRAVNDNIKKFLQYQLAINFAGCALTVVGSLISENSKEPLAPVQLLWLNLIMDTLAALSLATERPEEASLSRAPVFKQANLITNKMIAFIGIHGVYQFIITMLILLLGHIWFTTVDYPGTCDQEMPASVLVAENVSVPLVSGVPTPTLQVLTNVSRSSSRRLWCEEKCRGSGGVPIWHRERVVCQQGVKHSTLMFNTFIWFQVFNSVNARKIYGEINCFEGLIDRSRVMIIVFGIIIVLQVLVVEFADRFMAVSSQRWDYWLIAVGIGLTELIVGLIVRVLPIEDSVPDFALEKAAREIERRKMAAEASAAADSRMGHPNDDHTESMSGSRRKSLTHSDPSLRRSHSIMKKR